MMAFLKRLILILPAVLILSNGQEYNDYQEYADGYQQDNLYADYAMKQQEKR